MPKGNFDSAVIQPDDTVRVKGPFRAEHGDPEKPALVAFFLEQGTARVGGEGHWQPGADEWIGTCSSNGLTPGPAHGTALAVLHDVNPAFVTFGWNSPVEIKQG
jgi:hypothetical protein